jgi:hypothetical protein
VKELDAATVHTLAKRIHGFYSEFEIPPKSEKELRPYLSPRWRATESRDYYQGDHFNDHFEYKFDPTKVKALEPHVKAYLLYCDSVCIYDQLPPLLDYSRLDPNGDLAARRLPAVVQLLQEYAALAPLLRRNILIPVADEIFHDADKKFALVSDEEKNEIVASLARAGHKLSRDIAASFGHAVKREWLLMEYMRREFDLYFPGHLHVNVYQGLLKALEKRFSSKDITEPFNVGILGNLSTINPNKISVKDIVQVRLQEDAFQEFRVFLRGVFDRMNKDEHNFSDFDTEFASAVREEMNQKKETIRRLTEKSGLLREIFSQSDRLIVGAVAGGLAGWTSGSLETGALVVGVAGVVAPALYDLIRGEITRSSDRDTRLSMRNHFLALGKAG